MKAEVTAENRPAYDTSQHSCTHSVRTTYEYQRCVRVLVVFLYKFPIVFLGLLAVMSIKFAAKILRDWWRVFFRLDEGLADVLARHKRTFTQPPDVRFVPHPRTHLNFSDPDRDWVSELALWKTRRTIRTLVKNPFRNRLGRSHSCVLWALLQHRVRRITYPTTHRLTFPVVCADGSLLVDRTGSSAPSSRLQPQRRVRRIILRIKSANSQHLCDFFQLRHDGEFQFSSPRDMKRGVRLRAGSVVATTVQT